MKQCARCGEYKDEEEFNWRWKSLGVRQSICRDCQSVRRWEHYERHQEEEKARSMDGNIEKFEPAYQECLRLMAMLGDGPTRPGYP